VIEPQPQPALDLYELFPTGLMDVCPGEKLLVETEKPFPGWRIFWVIGREDKPLWSICIGPNVVVEGFAFSHQEGVTYEISGFFEERPRLNWHKKPDPSEWLDFFDILPSGLTSRCVNMRQIIEREKPFHGWHTFWAMVAPKMPIWAVCIGPEVRLNPVFLEKVKVIETPFYQGYAMEGANAG
jgi:hypothetical protein